MSSRRKQPASPAISSLIAGLAVPDNHPDAELIRKIERCEVRREFLDRHPDRFRDKEVLEQLRPHLGEWVKLGDEIAGTPARSRLGLHAKAMLALRDADPRKPCGGDWNGIRMADFVLFDAWRMGALTPGGAQ